MRDIRGGEILIFMRFFFDDVPGTLQYCRAGEDGRQKMFLRTTSNRVAIPDCELFPILVRAAVGMLVVLVLLVSVQEK